MFLGIPPPKGRLLESLIFARVYCDPWALEGEKCPRSRLWAPNCDGRVITGRCLRSAAYPHAGGCGPFPRWCGHGSCSRHRTPGYSESIVDHTPNRTRQGGVVIFVNATGLSSNPPTSGNLYSGSVLGTFGGNAATPSVLGCAGMERSMSSFHKQMMRPSETVPKTFTRCLAGGHQGGRGVRLISHKPVSNRYSAPGRVDQVV